jgi:hypothetical protein
MLAAMAPPADTVAQRIERDELFFDSAIVQHSFTPFMRDYDVIVDVPAAKPDGGGSYIVGRYRYRFTHCTEAIARTTVTAKAWQASWDDLFTDRETWERAGEPAGYVWGVEWADAYPGLTYVQQSERAAGWTELVARQMHEVQIESNVLHLTLVFHDLRIDQLAVGDPTTGTLTPLD